MQLNNQKFQPLLEVKMSPLPHLEYSVGQKPVTGKAGLVRFRVTPAAAPPPLPVPSIPPPHPLVCSGFSSFGVSQGREGETAAYETAFVFSRLGKCCKLTLALGSFGFAEAPFPWTSTCPSCDAADASSLAAHYRALPRLTSSTRPFFSHGFIFL